VILYLLAWVCGAGVGAIAATVYLHWALTTGRRRIRRRDLEQL